MYIANCQEPQGTWFSIFAPQALIGRAIVVDLYRGMAFCDRACAPALGFLMESDRR